MLLGLSKTYWPRQTTVDRADYKRNGPFPEKKSKRTWQDRRNRQKAHDHIEFVSVHNEVGPPVGSCVDHVPVNLDSAEVQPCVIPKTLIVIAGNENDANTLACFAQNLLNDVVVRLWPMRPTSHFPEVDDIAD